VPVLIVEHGATLAPPVLVVHDASAAGTRALDFARELSRALEWEIAVFWAQGISSGNDAL
jgi:hypothetical protein